MRRSRRGRDGKKSQFTPGRIVLVVVIAVGIGAIYLFSSQGSGSTLPGFPFPCLGSEGTAIHIHPYLRIMINAQDVPIPADVGIRNSGACFEPMHTHDASGIIHIESPSTNTQYTLKQFFQIWNATYHTVTINGTQHPVVFNSTDILGFNADASHKIVLLVDGKPSTDYGSLVLNSLAYCSAATPIPPCYPTAVGDPYYGGQPYSFGTGHTIVIEYTTSG